MIVSANLIISLNRKNGELQDSLTVAWARVAELEKTLNGRERAMQKIIERNMELQEMLTDQNGEGANEN